MYLVTRGDQEDRADGSSEPRGWTCGDTQQGPARGRVDLLELREFDSGGSLVHRAGDC